MNLQASIKSIEAPEFSKLVLGWNLDHPKKSQVMTENDSLVEIRGWILTNEEVAPTLILRSGKSVTRHSLNRKRHDVITKILKESADEHPQALCGFSVTLETDQFPLEVGFEIFNTIYWTRQIKLENVRKVVAGKAGYLFLANDTNHSIDQYEGRVLISDEGLDAWEQYFSSLSSRAKEAWTFLIAPAKEFIIPDCYPYERAAVTPVDQILQRFHSLNEQFLYPVELLKSDAHLTYSTGDTHWTDYGALLAAKAVCSKFGIPDPFREHLPPFHLTSREGDLISKYNPGEKLSLFAADFSLANSRIVFDNYIMNHGRTLIFENESSSSGKRAILFGDSFSTNLARWLSSAFSRLLFVHTAGGVDVEILKQENPDFVIVQSNSRFLINPPVYGLKIDEVISRKIKTFSESEKQNLQKRIDDLAQSNYKCWIQGLLAQ